MTKPKPATPSAKPCGRAVATTGTHRRTAAPGRVLRERLPARERGDRHRRAHDRRCEQREAPSDVVRDRRHRDAGDEAPDRDTDLLDAHQQAAVADRRRAAHDHVRGRRDQSVREADRGDADQEERRAGGRRREAAAARDRGDCSGQHGRRAEAVGQAARRHGADRGTAEDDRRDRADLPAREREVGADERGQRREAERGVRARGEREAAERDRPGPARARAGIGDGRHGSKV